MGKEYGIFKYKKGDIIQDCKRSFEIIDSYYIEKKRHKNGKEYTLNQKWYTYKCLKCGNVGEICEDSLTSNKSGCNVCCKSSRKIIKGVNDISTTAPWMMKYIVDEDYIFNNAKTSKKETLMVCPDCGREYYKSAYLVNANHGLACICGDGVRYPNKFLYSLLEQTGLTFETEKSFPWSNKRLYDCYVCVDGRQILIEMQGIQHYKRCINRNTRTLEEEQENDEFKKCVAKENGIDEYFVINASKSDCEFIKKSITESGLLDSIRVSPDNIDWGKCDEFATSNMYKTICEYHEVNSHESSESVAKHFKVSKQMVFRALKAGLKFGWCTITFKDSYVERSNNFLSDHGQKPLYCITNDTYYYSTPLACDILFKQNNIPFTQRALRKSIDRNNNYKGYKFQFITREQFNTIKSQSPGKCHGDFFIFKEAS